LKRELAPATAKKLAKLGIRTRLDLALHLPHRYEDETVLTPLDAVPAGQPVLVQARVLRAEVAFRPRRQLIVHAEGLVLRFFNFYPSQRKQFDQAAEQKLFVRAFGEVRSGWFGAEMAHPRYRLVREDEPLADALTPIYPTTAGVGQATLRKLVLEALEDTQLDDTLPAKMREQLPAGGCRREHPAAASAAAGGRCRCARAAQPPGLAKSQVRRAARAAAFDANVVPRAQDAPRAAAAHPGSLARAVQEELAVRVDARSGEGGGGFAGRSCEAAPDAAVAAG
jgi:hypothetical protein